MSYSFDGAGDSLDGSFASTYNGEGFTLAAFIKITSHPASTKTILNYGNNTADANDAAALKQGTTDDSWNMISTNSAASSANARVDLNVDNVWAGWVGTVTSDARRDNYLQALANTGSDTTSKVIADALQHIRVGRQLGGSQIFVGLIAEVAIWNVVLSGGDITSYLGGTAASGISAANLIGYWPLSASNSTQNNLGVDAGGGLAVTGATFDSDHPTITSGSTTISPNTAGMAV